MCEQCIPYFAKNMQRLDKAKLRTLKMHEHRWQCTVNTLAGKYGKQSAVRLGRRRDITSNTGVYT